MREAAAYVGLSKSSLDKMRIANPPKGPAYLRSRTGMIRYDVADLDAWNRAERVDPEAIAAATAAQAA